MRRRLRYAAAIARRVRGPYASLGRLDARLHELGERVRDGQGAVEGVLARLDAIDRALASLGGRTEATHELLSGEMRAAVRALAWRETENRERLYALRASSDYDAAWTESRPLVSVTVATRARPELLTQRSLPSILAQTYGAIEVVVVGDAADEATAEAVRHVGDPRIVYRNLTQHLDVADDPWRRWLVAATMARNEAYRVARGRWLVCFDDDDAMRPDHVEQLLARAREDRLEAVYGQAEVHRPGEADFTIGSFPPALGDFSWAAGMHHAGLRFLARELYAADYGVPGDWFLAERMLRAGVRFGMVDGVLADMYPSPMNRVQPGSTRNG
jgi:hypothetical protein